MILHGPYSQPLVFLPENSAMSLGLFLPLADDLSVFFFFSGSVIACTGHTIDPNVSSWLKSMTD